MTMRTMKNMTVTNLIVLVILGMLLDSEVHFVLKWRVRQVDKLHHVNKNDLRV